MGGVNLVAGFRPELWRRVAADASPAGVEGFNQDVVGRGDYRMPATQHDAVLWISGSAYDVVFDVARQSMAALATLAQVAEETSRIRAAAERLEALLAAAQVPPPATPRSGRASAAPR